LNFVYRRWPAAIRVLADDGLPTVPPFQEEVIYRVVRHFLLFRVRKTLKASSSSAMEERIFETWLRSEAARKVKLWWNSKDGWRSPVRFAGWSAMEIRDDLPRLDPYEVAHMRLPDDISTDPDVVLFQAWCQGVTREYFTESSGLKNNLQRAIKAGLRKFCASPWVTFALLAPWMRPVGVVFPSIGYLDTCIRLEHLLKYPYQASTGELRHIFESETFLTAKDRAWRNRKNSRTMNISGSWFVGGSPSQALGVNFKRSPVSHGREPVRTAPRKATL